MIHKALQCYPSQPWWPVRTTLLEHSPPWPLFLLLAFVLSTLATAASFLCLGRDWHATTAGQFCSTALLHRVSAWRAPAPILFKNLLPSSQRRLPCLTYLFVCLFITFLCLGFNSRIINMQFCISFECTIQWFNDSRHYSLLIKINALFLGFYFNSS